MPMNPLNGAHRRRILPWLVVASLGLAVLGWYLLRGAPGGLTVTLVKATPSRGGSDLEFSGEWDLELELRNDSGREILLPGLQMPAAPELAMGESDRPLDAEGRRRLGVWINGRHSASAVDAPADRPIEVTRCKPADLPSNWDTTIRLPAGEAHRSIRASLHVRSLDSVVGITYAPMQKPGLAVEWISHRFFLWWRRSPAWLGGTRARYLELRPPLRAGAVVDRPIPDW
jgi:hypothetical protein